MMTSKNIGSGAHRGRAPQTIKHELNLITAALKCAKRGGYEVPDVNPPAMRIDAGRLRYLTVDEEKRLLAELDPHREAPGLPALAERSGKKLEPLQGNYDLVVMLLDTGARYGEIAGLRWEQVDLANRTIALWRSKVKNESALFMTSRVAALLGRRALNRTCDFVFAK